MSSGDKNGAAADDGPVLPTGEDLSRLLTLLTVDEFDDIPSSLIVANVPDDVFSSDDKKKSFEDLFRKFDSEAEFTYYRSFHRVWVRFMTSINAVNAKVELHKHELHGNVIGCYFLEIKTRKGDAESLHLKPPKPQKQFLISPPASPPVGWEQEPEAAPVGLDIHLLSAIAQLAPGQTHELHHATDSQPGIVVHLCMADEDGNADRGSDDETELLRRQLKGNQVHTPCPPRN